MGSSKSRDAAVADPVVVFSMAIGDVYMCKWSGQEDNWEEKTNDPAKFPYHKDALDAQAQLELEKTAKKSKKKDASIGAALPDVVKKRLCIPFEFRFTNQEVSSAVVANG